MCYISVCVGLSLCVFGLGVSTRKMNASNHKLTQYAQMAKFDVAESFMMKIIIIRTTIITVIIFLKITCNNNKKNAFMATSDE